MVVHPARFIRWIFRGALWRVPTQSPTVYLTFDDGPVPEVTPWVLNLLKEKGIKATFFCVGQNVDKHPLIYKQVITEGHAIGNHTYNHVKAWKMSNSAYLKNATMAKSAINSTLFRPPHGQMWPWTIWWLKKQFNTIVMWDVLSFDYNKDLTSHQVLKNITTYTRPGSIIVFHDSIKAWPHLQTVLPLAIDWLIEKGYSFEKLKS